MSTPDPRRPLARDQGIAPPGRRWRVPPSEMVRSQPPNAAPVHPRVSIGALLPAAGLATLLSLTLCGTAVAAGAGTSVPGSAGTGSAAGVPGATVYRAATYGAMCDGRMHVSPKGRSEDNVGIQAAIDAAEASGGTVLLPPGHCILDSALHLQHGAGITLEGSLSARGKRLTTVTDTVNPKANGGAVDVTSNHDTVQDLILDESAYGGAVYVQADYTTFQRTTVLGGRTFYAMFFVALHSGAHAVGNRLLHSRVVSLVDRLVLGGAMACDDGLSWANQDRSLIQDLTFVGTRVALFQDTNTTVQHYTYHPGSQTCGLDGFYISEPSTNITMNDLVMFGSGGVIGNGSHTNGYSSRISITDEHLFPPEAGRGFTLRGTSHGLIIRNVFDVTVAKSDFASGYAPNAAIEFEPTTSTSAVVIHNCTVPRVSFFAEISKGYTSPGTVRSVTFHDDRFPALGPSYAVDATFDNGTSAAVQFTVKGGIWRNQIAGAPRDEGFAHGRAMTYSVSYLRGY